VVGNCILLYQSHWLTTFLRIVSLPGDGVWLPVILTVLTAVLIYKLRGDKWFALVIVIAPLIGNVVKHILKAYFAVPRPEVFGCQVLTTYADGYSFPSGHTVYFTIFFGLLAYYGWKNRAAWWARALLFISAFLILSIGYSRVYLGAHWYLDVFAGYVVGFTVLLAAILIYEYLTRRSHAAVLERKLNSPRQLDEKGNVRSAGAIISRKKNGTREFLLVRRSFEGDISFPKGRIDAGESAKEAATREVEEETGFRVELGKKLAPISYNYPEGGGVVVEMFEGQLMGKGKKTEKNEVGMWVVEDKVPDKLTHKNLIKYFKEYLGENTDV